MKKLDFNSGWTFRKAEEPPAAARRTCPGARGRFVRSAPPAPARRPRR